MRTSGWGTLAFVAALALSCNGPAQHAAVPPTIASFTANPAAIQPGQSSTLSWTVIGATGVTIDNGVGDVTAVRSKIVTPAATTTYKLTAANGAGSVSQPATITVTATAPDATVAVDTSQNQKAISPYIYGYNAADSAHAPPGATWLRLGGNRWTAYNWTNNYSNAGTDYGPYHNDNLMGAPADGPGHAAVPSIDDTKAHGLGLLVTIPIQGWVSKAVDGYAAIATPPSASWFVPTQPRKGSAFTLSPLPDSSPVYEDEFANFVSNRWGSGATPIHFSLDNEPDLWASTHAEIQRSPLHYTDLLPLSTAAADAIKSAVPGALVYGPVSYGYAGYLSLQSAPDSVTYGDFLNYYLDQMSAASTSKGKRLLDVLDLHFYSESRGCGIRVNDATQLAATRNGDCLVAARVQATRSLWDPAYKEPSWITGCCTNGGGIQLIPNMLAKIAAHYAGTRLAITEYNHGGGDHISGAVAQADTLGIFGREGVFAASYWALLLTGDTWTYASWRAYRNYDGAGANYPDLSVQANSTDVPHVASYAGLDATNNRVVLVLIHRPLAVTDSGGNITGSEGLQPRTVHVQVTHPMALGTVRGWQLSGGVSPSWQTLPLTVSGNALDVTLPALSVTTIELKP